MRYTAIMIAASLILAFFVPATSHAILINLEAIGTFEDINGPDKFTIKNVSSPDGMSGALIVKVVIDTSKSVGGVVFDTHGPFLPSASGPVVDEDNTNNVGFNDVFTFGDFTDADEQYARTLTLDFNYAESNVFNSGDIITFWTDTDANSGTDGSVDDEEFAGTKLSVTFRGNSAADNFAPYVVSADYGTQANPEDTFDTNAVPTPEPATLLLLGSGLAGLGLLGRKKFKGTKT